MGSVQEALSEVDYCVEPGLTDCVIHYSPKQESAKG